MQSNNPYACVEDFENRIAEWSGAMYSVSVESCTSAIFLSLMYRYRGRHNGEVTLPKFTYPGVACSIIHAGLKIKFVDDDWGGCYTIEPCRIVDGALRFKKDMYAKGSLHCLSFHIKKLLPIGRGGMILTDDRDARDWLRRARFDGRNPVPLKEDYFDMLGWNCYMTTEQAARGIQLFEVLRQKYPDGMEDLKVEDQKYPDLSKFPIYQQ